MFRAFNLWSKADIIPPWCIDYLPAWSYDVNLWVDKREQLLQKSSEEKNSRKSPKKDKYARTESKFPTYKQRTFWHNRQ